MSATSTAPHNRAPSPCSSPGLSAAKVTVRSARTASPGVAPESASTPEGRSTARTGVPPGARRRVIGAAEPGAVGGVDDQVARREGDARGGRGPAASSTVHPGAPSGQDRPRRPGRRRRCCPCPPRRRRAGRRRRRAGRGRAKATARAGPTAPACRARPWPGRRRRRPASRPGSGRRRTTGNARRRRRRWPRRRCGSARGGSGRRPVRSASCGRPAVQHESNGAVRAAPRRPASRRTSTSVRAKAPRPVPSAFMTASLAAKRAARLWTDVGRAGGVGLLGRR